MSNQLFFIARFDGKHARIPRGYEVRFSAPYRGLSISNMSSLCSNKFRAEIAEQACAQGACEQFNVDRNVLLGLATENHFTVECPALEAQKREKELAAQKRKSDNDKMSRPKKDTAQSQQKPKSASKPASANRKTSSAGSDVLFKWVGGCIAFPFVLLYKLYFSSWRCEADMSAAGKVWFWVKTAFRLTAAVIVAILIFAGCIILVKAYQESSR